MSENSRSILTRLLTAWVGILLAAPLAGRGAEPILLVGGQGNQTAPSMSGAYLAFLDDVGGNPDVYVKDLLAGTLTRVTDGGGVFGGPDAARTFLAYRRDGTVEVYDARALTPFLTIPAPGNGGTALSANLVAWEQDSAGGADVGWRRLLAAGAPVVLARPGQQHAVAASVDWLAFIDDAGDGSVHLIDTRDGTESVVFAAAPGGAGTIQDVAVWAADANGAPLVAVLVEGPGGGEIALVDRAGLEQRRLTVPGAKVNPHLNGDWIGFEDLSTGVSQVVLWDWSVDRLYVPAPTGSVQVLHDLVTADTGLKVVWADRRSVDFDIFLFETALPLPPPPPPPPVEVVNCADPDAVVLADFTVLADGKFKWLEPRGHGHDGHDRHDRNDRDDHDVRNGHDGRDGDDGHDGGDHRVGDGDRGRFHPTWRGVGGSYFPADVPTGVLLCIDATDVASAWVGVGSEVVASPADFSAGTLTLEARLTVAAGDGRAGAVLAGKRGASMRVRVLADPGGNGNGASDGSTCSARGDCPRPPRGIVAKATSGCSSAGDVGALASLLLAGFAAARPLRRRTRS